MRKVVLLALLVELTAVTGCLTGAPSGFCSVSSDCLDDEQCIDGVCCTSNRCRGQLGDEQPCSNDDMCRSGNCTVAGMCCEAGCEGGCRDGVCLLSFGETCDDSDQCGSGHCLDSVCCNVECAGPCSSCTLSSSRGMCTPLEPQEVPGCEPSPSAGAQMCYDGECLGPRMLRDINQGGGPSSMVALSNGTILFDGYHPSSGRELWSYIPGQGSRLVIDATPGPESGLASFAEFFVDPTQPRAFYLATTPQWGQELWVSDGTAEGTRLVMDIASGDSDGVTNLKGAFVGDTFVFLADDGVTGSELWATNVMTTTLLSLNPGAAGISLGSIATIGNAVVFTITTGGSTGLWRTAGSMATTTQLQAFNFFDSTLLVLNGVGYFSGDAGDAGVGVWRTDGTIAGTYLVGMDTSLHEGAILGSTLVYGDGRDPSTVYAINLAGHLPVNPPVVKGFGANSQLGFTTFKGAVYFDATTPEHGRELWRTDGTTAERITDLREGTRDSSIEDLTVVGGYLYFTAHSDDIGRELFRTDGETLEQTDTYPGPDSGIPTIIGTTPEAVFAVSTTPQGRELIVWNTTSTIVDLHPGTNSSYPDVGVRVGDDFIVPAVVDQSEYLLHLFESNGALAGTVGGAGLGNADTQLYFGLVGPDDRIYFIADDGALGAEWWVTDGTTEGTYLLVDVSPGRLSGAAMGPGLVGDTMLIGGTTAATGTELFVTDGTAEGTELFVDINPGPLSGEPNHFTHLGDLAIFSAKTDDAGVEPWVTDGTREGTVMLGDLSPGPTSSSPASFVRVGELVYFLAVDGAGDTQLYSTNGEPAGTQPLTSGSTLILPCRETSMVHLPATNTLVFVTADNSISILWAFDLEMGEGPTPLATSEVGRCIDIGPVRAGDLAYFIWDDSSEPALGYELWATNGTPKGTQLVADIWPGATNSKISNLTAVGDDLYFVADDGVHGREPWKSRGTTPTTTMLHNIAPGAQESLPSLIHVENRVFILTGDRLWVTGGDATTTYPACPTAMCKTHGNRQGAMLNGRMWFPMDSGVGFEPSVYP